MNIYAHIRAVPLSLSLPLSLSVFSFSVQFRLCLQNDMSFDLVVVQNISREYNTLPKCLMHIILCGGSVVHIHTTKPYSFIQFNYIYIFRNDCMSVLGTVHTSVHECISSRQYSTTFVSLHMKREKILNIKKNTHILNRLCTERKTRWEHCGSVC